MIALVLCLSFAAPPELPVEADYSPRILRQWSRDTGLTDQERAAVESIATKWEDAFDEWREGQESRIVRAMERT